MSNKNDSPAQKIAWKENQSLAVHPRIVRVGEAGKRSAKNHRSPKGSFAVRTLKSLAGKI